MVNKAWLAVFLAAVAKAKEIMAKNPKLAYKEAISKAWGDPVIKKLREEYNKKKALNSKKSAVGGRRVTRKAAPRKTTTRKKTVKKDTVPKRKVVKRKVVKRTVVKKVTKRKTVKK